MHQTTPHCSGFEKLNAGALYNHNIVIMHYGSAGPPQFNYIIMPDTLGDLINVFIIIPCVNKSLSSSLSADNLSSHGGIEYPLPFSG